MAKVGCFELAGIDCWFYSSEIGHEPHFHARKRGHWHVRVFFLRQEDIIEKTGPGRMRLPGRDERALCDMAKRYRAKLLKEWEDKVLYE